MRYLVTLEPGPRSTPVVVDVEERPSGELEVHVDGRRAAVDVATVGAQLSVRVDGKIVDLTTEGSLPELHVVANGQRRHVRVESERQRAADAARGASAEKSEKVIVSQMPGRIVQVLAQKGDVVEAGQPLLVMEAMKMENEIRAKSAGTVVHVHVVAGAAVEINALLVTLG